jgi:hypothetical protein
MRQLSVIPGLLIVATVLVAGCATAPAEPEPNVAAANIPEPSRQKCATTTGSRIATTCSNMVKSTDNLATIREMQRHIPMSGGN